MTSKIQVTRVACNTSTGTQDITISGFGTPKAALFVVTRGVTDETLAAHAIIGWGVADGTNQRAFTAKHEDNQGTTDADCRCMTDECIAINDVDNTIDGEANFDSFITDGVRINWGNAPAAGYLLTVILFGGDIQVNVRDITTTATLGATTSDTTCGFEPDVIFFGGNGFIPFNDFNNTAYLPVLGIATNESGGIKQGLMAVTDGNGFTTSGAGVHHSNKYCQAAYFTSGGYAGAMELTSFDANGFTVTHREDTTVTVPAAFLAIKFDDNSQFELDFIDSPTSTGDHDITSIGFQPNFVYQLVSFIDTEESSDTAGAEAGSFGISVFDGTNEYCIMISTEDNVGTTNTNSISSDKAVKVIDNAGTVVFEGSFDSFLSNGWRINYPSTVDGTARKWIALAIQNTKFTPRMMTY